MKRLAGASCLVILFAAAVAAQTMPVTVSMYTAENSKPMATVTNQYHAALTAFALEPTFAGHKRGGGSIYDDARLGSIYDARLNVGHDVPIMTGESQTEGLPPTSGGAPLSAAVIAALFADGTSAGDAEFVAILKARRQGYLSQIDVVEAKLREVTGHHWDIATLIAALKTMQQDFSRNAAFDAARDPALSVYQDAIDILQSMGRTRRAPTADDAIPEI